MGHCEILVTNTNTRTHGEESNIFIMLKHVALIFIVFSGFGVLCQDNTTTIQPNVTTSNPNVTTSNPNVTTIITTIGPNVTSIDPNVTTINPNVTTMDPNVTTGTGPQPIITDSSATTFDPTTSDPASSAIKNTFKIVLPIFI